MKEFRYSFSAMASPCELRLYAERASVANKAAELAQAEVLRIEQTYSRYRDDSIVSRINAAAGLGPIAVDPETAALLNYAATAYQQSDGLFDITSGVLRRVWDFKSGQLPSDSAIADILPLVGWDKVHWDGQQILLTQPGMQLDFGGFGKEWAADSAARICREAGIEYGLVELGGDIHAMGPHPDGSPWQIGIRHPRDPENAIAVLPLKSGGLASSGDYERFMVVDGQRYSHILNPKTGWPITESFSAVSVVAPLCLLAGTGATVAMLKGQVEARNWLNSLELPFLLVAPDGQVIQS
ncbi:FAD:protein FMN transferase [Spongiibacter sp. KMU-158]|uniref:FAD:protein FMN transferase n=1 Tax=Spongiibacter pelagi TaxID=2760804 RepID=A0A927C3N1_9GAMM|nr:FAD:protein FMN transferase [Spongiibacter pelagi]MBD2858880.1 FAD:protein FMN transferase [Spongiibacter pelagi]